LIEAGALRLGTPHGVALVKPGANGAQ